MPMASTWYIGVSKSSHIHWPTFELGCHDFSQTKEVASGGPNTFVAS